MLSERDYMTGAESRRVSCILPIIVLNGLVYLFCQFGDGGIALQELLVLHPYYLKHFQLWRLVTYMFAHGSLTHILFNMWGLYMFGSLLERTMGFKRFLNLYFFSGIIGALLWCMFNWNDECTAVVQNGIHLYSLPLEHLGEALENGFELKHVSGGCIGASGGIMGITVAAAMAFPDLEIMLLFPPVRGKLRKFIWVFIIIDVICAFEVSSRVAHLAHLGGALGAFLYMRRLCPRESWLMRFLERFRSKNKVYMRGPNNMSVADAQFIGSEEVARVFEKANKVGLEGLTAEERAILKRVEDILGFRR